MNCLKCEKEVSEGSKFCNNCGSEIKEKPIHTGFDDTMKMCAKSWYILGYMHGINRNDKKSLEEFEDLVKRADVSLYEWYKEVVQYWEDRAIGDDEELKEKIRLKRTGISETKRVQKKK
ncbi:MAG TPA: zinc ribbon domain-containing protein [Candidatus Paceibacterota bacterium]|nr:zinc ribbon domain-containing protein [Candidatus Paceibacterota bacterium]